MIKDKIAICKESVVFQQVSCACKQWVKCKNGQLLQERAGSQPRRWTPRKHADEWIGKQKNEQKLPHRTHHCRNWPITNKKINVNRDCLKKLTPCHLSWLKTKAKNKNIWQLAMGIARAHQKCLNFIILHCHVVTNMPCWYGKVSRFWVLIMMDQALVEYNVHWKNRYGSVDTLVQLDRQMNQYGHIRKKMNLGWVSFWFLVKWHQIPHLALWLQTMKSTFSSFGDLVESKLLMNHIA